MAAPTFISTSASQFSVNPITLVWPTSPAHEVGDIGIVIMETNGEVCGLASGTGGGGWVQVPGSPVLVSDATPSALEVFWKRATIVPEGDVVSNNPVNHVLGRICVFRGCIATGNPWDVIATGTESTSDTSAAIVGATTTVADCLVLAMLTAGTDVGTAGVGSEANADLTSLTERVDAATTTGDGGRLYMATGIKATAGTYGVTTCTLNDASPKAYMTIALKPPTGAAGLATRKALMGVGI